MSCGSGNEDNDAKGVKICVMFTFWVDMNFHFDMTQEYMQVCLYILTAVSSY